MQKIQSTISRLKQSFKKLDKDVITAAPILIDTFTVAIQTNVVQEYSNEGYDSIAEALLADQNLSEWINNSKKSGSWKNMITESKNFKDFNDTIKNKVETEAKAAAKIGRFTRNYLERKEIYIELNQMEAEIKEQEVQLVETLTEIRPLKVKFLENISSFHQEHDENFELISRVLIENKNLLTTFNQYREEITLDSSLKEKMEKLSDKIVEVETEAKAAAKIGRFTRDYLERKEAEQQREAAEEAQRVAEEEAQREAEASSAQASSNKSLRKFESFQEFSNFMQSSDTTEEACIKLVKTMAEPFNQSQHGKNFPEGKGMKKTIDSFKKAQKSNPLDTILDDFKDWRSRKNTAKANKGQLTEKYKAVAVKIDNCEVATLGDLESAIEEAAQGKGRGGGRY